MTRTGLACGLALVGALTGCGEAVERARIPADADPDDVFTGLEARLTQAEEVRMDFHITASGAIEVDLNGTLQVSGEKTVLLGARGTFAGDSARVFMEATSSLLQVLNGFTQIKDSRPEHLNEALFIGFTRMGLLHNLAVLIGGGIPDHSEGGVRDWVGVDSLRLAAAEGGQGTHLSFGIVVSGVPSGNVILELDPQGLPVVRRQTVHFPSGDMEVVEQYRSVVITP